VLFNKIQSSLLQYPGGKMGSYSIPNSATSIGYGAFDGAAGLTGVLIPVSVTSISRGDVGPFAGCTGLTAFTVDSLNHSFSSVGGVLFDKTGENLIRYPVRRIGSYTTNNLEEKEAGTDPLDASSLLAFEAALRPEALVVADQTPIPSGQHALYFQSIPGMRYEILSTERIGGEWSTVETVSATTSQKRVLVDKAAQTAFYRIHVLPPE
jgi:hypothetical protein